MKLYHSLFFLIFTFLITACVASPSTSLSVQVQIVADGQTTPVDLTVGSTVQAALQQAGLNLESLDRVDPPLHTAVSDGLIITLNRVWEQFEIEQLVLPFEQQLL